MGRCDGGFFGVGWEVGCRAGGGEEGRGRLGCSVANVTDRAKSTFAEEVG